MLKEIHIDADLEFQNAGLIYRNFLPEDLSNQAIFFFHNQNNKQKFSGKVGEVFESYTDLYVCKESLNFLQEFKKRVVKRIPSDNLSVCSSLVSFGPLEGMTSHRDYSYNRFLLATLVLSGELLYGIGSTRSEAYQPQNMFLLKKGDLTIIPAPAETTIERPFFFMACPTKSLISRLWIRSPDKCPHCRNRGENGH